MADISKVNLNLVVALEALLEHRSVTKAGDILNLSQSATSYLLNQLREIFNDQILIRGKGEMIPTELGSSLLEPARDIIRKADQLVTIKKPFDPKTHTEIINIGMNDYAIILFLPKLLRTLKDLSPGITLKIHSIGIINSASFLLENSLDIAITRLNKPLLKVKSELLFADEFVCVCDHNSSLYQDKITLAEYKKAEHVYITFGEQKTFLEKQLRQQGINRDVVMTIPNPLGAMFLLADSNYVATVLSRLAAIAKDKYKLKIFPAPFKVKPMPVYQVAHITRENNPCIMWVMKLIQQISKKIQQPF